MVELFNPIVMEKILYNIFLSDEEENVWEIFIYIFILWKI